MREKIESMNQIIETTKTENQSVYENVLLPEDDLTKRFNEFIISECIVRPDVEEFSVDLEGRYRLWSQLKPTKEVFHALKNYLDTRFKPKRISNSKNHGYAGIKLKVVEYKKRLLNSNVETFIFQVCQFSNCGKILNSVLLNEYQKWKQNVGLTDTNTNKENNTNNDMKEIKEYLNASPYALKATVWTEHGNNEGYYGLSLKQDINKNLNTNVNKSISTTGKKVEKRENKGNQILGTWDSIAAAALAENMSAAKMSRSVKNKQNFGDYYYCISTT